MATLAGFFHKTLKLEQKTAVRCQFAIGVIGLVTIVIFADFFVSLSILIALLYPLYVMYTWLVDNIYMSLYYLRSV